MAIQWWWLLLLCVCVQMSGGAALDTSAEGSEAVVAEEYKDKDKKTLDSCVPNVVITCTADDDTDTAADALQMIQSFSFPTADEVLLFTICSFSVSGCWHWTLHKVSNASSFTNLPVDVERMRPVSNFFLPSSQKVI